ncbi:hypothetical protein MRB53_015734 [Persea americana]|uniref:Uncharacterized protein n=1 Tax=Persea americana TaxID=3435 RepID=A0ACC2M058_PERAE|nr:hypothetical protein MRB53_015734 [Persea americana]|eukprot:TRINITY_DN17699_c0_g3_i1.p1 TRINITY_DN17699_c0_g3~~TRINITY_DN17699_c0_g3_i1.p1  ORF type:complete len:701 (-),score=138.83 TRINITY_DN17699_c0_g3_i1:465-2432(-)
MAEATTPAKQKAPIASRLQSPTSPFFLGSNDDQLERAQARAARAAASRRKSAAPPPPSVRVPSPDLFTKDQIFELFQNCIKLASENKINQKNTWDLRLIDHLSELIRVEDDDDAETNFQKASCTLEAGVKIYSLRVDSVHSEAYKVLGGINRVGREEDTEPTEGPEVDAAQDEGRPKKETERKISPLSTLESSFEALNVKKFDAAFAVDPLYHQTSAQFDEGGAKGLLLNTLGVYGGCRVLFDSLETPGKSMACAAENDNSEVIDISFARECIEEMMTCMPRKSDISPSLREIVNLFDEDNRRPSDVPCVSQKAMDQNDVGSNDQPEWEGNAFDDCDGPCTFDCEDQNSVFDESSTFVDINSASHYEENYDCSFHEPDMGDGLDKIAGFLSLGLGFISKQNAWAGPDHWKYRKVKEQVQVSESESLVTSKRSKTKKQAPIDIDFTKSLDTEMPDIFSLPKNPKSLLLPANRSPCNTILPEDCHYQPEDLVKLFLLPNVLCLGKRRKSKDDSAQQNHAYQPSWDNESVISDHFDDGNVLSDVEDSTTLVSQPRQVNKVEVQYDKSSKQVDVHALKQTLWNCIQQPTITNQMGNEAVVSFRHVLSSFPDDCTAAASKDISPHLCFICLLHLANEHGLTVKDCTTLDELWIHVPLHAQ